MHSSFPSFLLGAVLVASSGGAVGLPLARLASPPGNANSARTYYVDSAQGDDRHLGNSPAEAWRTLDRVNSTTFAPGDRILFRSGREWGGQLWPKGSGTAEHPIVIDKYGGDVLPLIKGQGRSEDALLLKNQQYWEVSDLEITNTGPSSAVRRGVHVVSENYGDLHHIYLRSLTVHDVNGADSEKANGGIDYSAIGDTKASRFVDLRIEDNHIRHVDRSGIFGWSTHWTRSKWYPSLGVVVRGNVLDDIGGDGIVVVAADGALIEHNVLSHANQRSEGYNDGIWPWSSDNTVVQFNEVYGMRGERDGEGFDSDWNSRNTVIQYNYSHDNQGGFLLICNDGSQSPADSAGNTGTVVRYNISQNDHHRGINLSGPVDHTLIYNNTIYVGRQEDVDLVLQTDWHGWAKDTFFFNNIFYVAGTARLSYGTIHQENGAYRVAPGPGGSSNNVFDSNVYYGVPPEADPHGLTSDPLLAGGGDAGIGRTTASAYRLRPGSRARDSGKTISDNGGRDFFGTAVPQCGAVDRGAAESADCRSPQ